MEKELAKTKQKAEERNWLKSAFLNNISHEIRTPMNGIIGFAEMLKNLNITDERQKNYSDIIISSAYQLLSIVESIIQLSTLDSGEELVNKEKICINDILFKLQNTYLPKAKSQNINLYSKKSLHDSQVYVYTDKTKLYQILDNLVSNSLKFTHKGYIEFGYKLEKGFIQFYVKDTGIGIEKELHEKVFDRFWQADMGPTRKYHGTGIGLTIAKSYIELLGGKIWFTSEVNLGTSIYFAIPYEPVLEDYIPKVDIKPDKKVYWADKSILIAEDEEINYTYLEQLLFETGIKIFHAKNGREAVEYCKTFKIDLVLMDIKMPILNGYEATEEIKKFKPNIPIIAQTAYSNIKDKQKAFKSGCNDFISKPIKHIELIETIEKQILKNKIELELLSGIYYPIAKRKKGNSKIESCPYCGKQHEHDIYTEGHAFSLCENVESLDIEIGDHIIPNTRGYIIKDY